MQQVKGVRTPNFNLMDRAFGGSSGGGGDSALAIEILAQSPDGYWKLNDVSGGAADSSGNGKNGTEINGTIDYQGIVGPDGGYMGFDGTSYINVASDVAWGVGGNIQLAVVCLVNFTTTGVTRYPLAKAGDASTRQWAIAMNGPNGALAASYVGSTFQRFSIFDNAFTSGEWSLVIANFTVDDVALFVDSATQTESSSGGAGAPTSAGTGPLTFGIDLASPASPMIGGIAHVAIFPTVRDGTQIAAIHAAAIADGWI